MRPPRTSTMTDLLSYNGETIVNQLTGLCRPRQQETLALQWIPHPHRHNPEVGIMHLTALNHRMVKHRHDAGVQRLTSVNTDQNRAGRVQASLAQVGGQI